VSDDDGTTRASTSGTIDATGTNDGVSVWRDSDQRKECEQSERKRFHFLFSRQPEAPGEVNTSTERIDSTL